MTEIERVALKPCPFCGAAAEWNTGQTGDGKPWRYLACEVCEAMGPHVSPIRAHTQEELDALVVEAWNSRAAIAAVQADRPVAEGWVMVPREPTEAPLNVLVKAMHYKLGYDDAEDLYRAMIDAALTPANAAGER